MSHTAQDLVNFLTDLHPSLAPLTVVIGTDMDDDTYDEINTVELQYRVNDPRASEPQSRFPAHGNTFHMDTLVSAIDSFIANMYVQKSNRPGRVAHAIKQWAYLKNYIQSRILPPSFGRYYSEAMCRSKNTY